MAAGAIGLPPGFELEEGSKLPEGFEIEQPQDISKLKSAAAGAAQGATLGFADEGAAAISALPRIAKDIGSGKFSPQAFLDYYRKSRGALRGNMEAAKEANPKSYTAGEFVGGAATSPLIGEANIAKLAALGALQGLGSSQSDDLSGMATDTAIGAGTGAGFGMLSNSAQKTMDAMKWAGKKGISTFLGPTEEAINARLKDPEGIKNALSHSQLAEKVPGSMTKLQGQIQDADQAAWGALGKSIEPTAGGIPVDSIVNKLQELKSSLVIPAGDDSNLGATVGAAHHKAAMVMDNFMHDIKQFLPDTTSGEMLRDPKSTGMISEEAQRGIIQAADDNIDWNNPDLGVSNRLLKGFREYLDSQLKTNNPNYREAMIPVAEKTDLFEGAKRALNLKNEVGHGLVPSDTTASKLEFAGNDKRLLTRDILERLKNETGDDYLTQSQNASFSKQFEGGKANGSRSVNQMMGIMAPVGAGVGAFLGGPAGASVGAGVGAAAGAAAGSYIDKKGGKMAGELIDWYIKNSPDQLGKYAAPLMQAARNGTQAVATANFVLMNRDPEYRAMVERLQGEPQ